MSIGKLAIIGGGTMGKTIAKRLLDAKTTTKSALEVTVRRSTARHHFSQGAGR